MVDWNWKKLLMFLVTGSQEKEPLSCEISIFKVIENAAEAERSFQEEISLLKQELHYIEEL